jgi:acetyltransferase
MLAMCESLGFQVKLDPDDPTLMNVSLPVPAST